MKKFLLILVSLVLLVSLCSCAEVIDGILCDILGVTNSHVHSFGEWETKTAADCENAEVEVRKCECGEEELRPGDAALGHTIVSISAVCTKEDYMQGDVASASDFQVIANCECGASLEVTDEVTLENATLANEGENTVTVNCGEFSTTVVVNASKFVLVLDGSLVEDTYVSADKKNDNYIERETMGTNSSTFRVFFKFNFSNILSNEQFLADIDNAKVQFSFTIVEGAYTETSTFTFGGYIPGEGVSDIDFASITWNAIRNTAFDWANAVYPIDQAVGSHHVSYTDNLLTLTFTYGQIKDFIDADGNAIFTFRAQQSGVKISSKEGVAAPSVKVIVDDSHLHAFDQRIESEQYFISANCEEATYYYKSCRCGEHGDDYFKTETINEHVFGEWDVITPATCTEDGVKTRHCTLCEDGVEEGVVPALTHEYTSEVTAPTCTAAGYTTYTCIRGDHTYTDDETAAKGHTSNNTWANNDSYHWTNCVDCGAEMNNDTHKGGTATETEQAVCDTCKAPYGGLASHVHSHSASVTAPTCTTAGFTTYTCACGDVYVGDEVAASGHKFGEWEVVHPATCEGNEVLVHYCDCGESETGTGAAAFGHDMQTKYDENNHWTECAHNCGLSTEAVAHFGGTATETEQATCEGCGQKYGELKAEEKEVTVNGTIKQDTYITSDSSGSNKNFADRAEINCNNGKNFRPIFEFNLANALNSAELQANKESAKVEFTFAVSTGTADLFDVDGAKFSIYGFIPGEGVSDVDFTTLTWNSCKDTGANSQFYRKDTNTNLSIIILNQTKDVASAYYTLSEVDGVLYITYTLDYTAIEHLICTTAGDNYGDIVMGFDFNQTIKFASMENTKYAAPAVSVTYTK